MSCGNDARTQLLARVASQRSHPLSHSSEAQIKVMQKQGGIAALIAAATCLVGFAVCFTLMDASDYGAKGGDPL